MTTIVNLVQQSPEWHAHRAAHWNASDAPAMLGASSLKKRTELLREVSTGVEREFSDYVQGKIIDPGHTFEALAREVAESIIGEDLYPCVVVDGKLSASLDGLTVGGDTAWEHKRLNKALRDAMSQGHTGSHLPEMYRIQCEHQLIVSKAERVLFMASEWDDEGNLIEERHCWYFPDAELRARIVAGWEQFAVDLQDYQPREHAPAPIGRAPGHLMPLVIEATGVVTHSNAEEWEAAVSAYLGNINRELVTDQDFANAEATVKWCATVEAELEAKKAKILDGSESVASLLRLIDRVQEQVRQTRLPLSSLTEKRKLARRTEIVERGRQAVLAHYTTINASLGAHAITAPASLAAELGAAIKGKKSFTSMDDAVDSAVANLKIAASQRAGIVRENVDIFQETEGADELSHLFPDVVQLFANKAPDDLRNLVLARIADHKAKEKKRLDDERERIRAEEVAKLERERLAEIERARPVDNTLEPVQPTVQTPTIGALPADATGRFTDEQIASAFGVDPGALIAPPFKVPRSPSDYSYGDVYVPDPYQRDATIEERRAKAAADAAAPPSHAGVFVPSLGDPLTFPGTPSDLSPMITPPATIKLGDINTRIAPLSITADGMAKLGFTAMQAPGAAKLYRANDFVSIVRAMQMQLLQAVEKAGL